ncbi:MAG: endonuclease III domain-containing protein [Thermodesulfobacteriota bacterium]
MAPTGKNESDGRRPVTRARLMKMFHRLLAAFGPRGWWPGETPFEVMVGAVLTQNTAWVNVDKALANLKQAGLMSPEALGRVRPEELAALIKPAGYYNVKARRLLNLIELVLAAGGGNPPRLLRRPPDRLRADLLAVKGVGPETADSILLYAAGVPVFVIDAYTRRVLARHHLIQGDEDYGRLQALFMDRLPPEAALFNEFHALLVHLGHRHCRAKPRCRGCPLDGH